MPDLMACRRPAKLSRNLVVRLEPEFVGRFADEFTIAWQHCLLLSQRMVDVLRKAGTDSFQTHPCGVAAPHGEVTPYQLMIIREAVHCVDRENSDLHLNDEDPRVIELIETLAIDEGRLDPRVNLLVRLGESPDLVIAHRSLIDTISATGLTGVESAPVDGSAPLPAPVDQLGGSWPPSVDVYLSRTVQEEEVDETDEDQES
jgi:hypothetical protein